MGIAAHRYDYWIREAASKASCRRVIAALILPLPIFGSITEGLFENLFEARELLQR
jgi:hypothetical protein